MVLSMALRIKSLKRRQIWVFEVTSRQQKSILKCEKAKELMAEIKHRLPRQLFTYFWQKGEKVITFAILENPLLLK